MEIIGIIGEYNPFHNGHIYHIQKIKEKYPESLIVLILNGYFLERGEISILNKENKTKIALDNNVDIIIELPFVFGSNSADIFADTSVSLLNMMGVNKIIFGSESNNIENLSSIAYSQLSDDFNIKVKSHLKEGFNYPTALNKAIGINIDKPNDLLGVSYIKSILKNNFNISAESIQRTNDYHDTKDDCEIISATNIREKLKNNINVNKYTSYSHLFNKINEELLFNLLKYKINTDSNLSQYLSVDEGIEYKLIKEINIAEDINDLILKIKSKRYTYNRIRRMLIHILIGLTKEEKENLKLEYIKILGFNNKGQKYISKIKSSINIPIGRKISDKFTAQKYELKASFVYDMITKDNTYLFEVSNKPITKVDC